MIGGKVIGYTKLARELRLLVEDTNGDRCTVRAEPFGVAVGDSVWWQGRTLFWGRAGEFSNRHVPRIGYSVHSPRLPKGLRAEAS